MLVLSRKMSETIQIGDSISIKVTQVVGGRVRLGITAPKDVQIVRGELSGWSGAPEEPALLKRPELVLV